MALAAVFFAFPFAIAFAMGWSVLNGLGMTDVALLYVFAGSGVMAAFIAAATVATLVERNGA